MKFKRAAGRALFGIATVGGLCLGTGVCLGQLTTPVISLTFDGVNAATGHGNFGYSFTVGSQPIQVTSLGVWDESGTGLAESHQVNIWEAGVSVVSATVGSGSGPDLIDGFRYVDLNTPVTLTPGSTYFISAFYPTATDSIALSQPPANVTLGTGLSLADGTTPHFASDQSQVSYPDQAGPGAAFGYYGPNAQFTVVPEPGATAAVAALGLLGFALWRRSMSKAAASVS